MTKPARSTSRGGRRTYSHPLDPAWNPPSVTTIIGVLDKPALPRWAARASAAWAVAHLDELAALVKTDEKAAEDLVAGSPWRDSRRAGNVGTDAHRMIERACRGETITREDRVMVEGRLDAWEAFARDWQPDVLHNELTVWSREFDYAGTLDLVVRVPALGAEPFVLDLKTGSGPWPEVALQLAAYRRAETATTTRLDEREIPMPTTTDGLVLMLAEDGGYGLYRADTSAAWPHFLNCRALYNWTSGVSRGVLDGPLEAPGVRAAA